MNGHGSCQTGPCCWHRKNQVMNRTTCHGAYRARQDGTLETGKPLRIFVGLLVILFVVFAQASPASAEDFLSRDKYYHAMGSMALAETGFGMTIYFQKGNSTGIPWAVGAASALIPGLLKEGFDATRADNYFSWRDLAWDGMGTLVGLTISQLLFLAFH